MARDPGSLWVPLPEAGAPDGYLKNKFIVHSTGDNGSAAATRRYFERGDVVVESTFIVGWSPDDPTLQIMDSSDLADANVSANDEGISVEVVGDGRSGFNAHQRSELVRLGLFARKAHPQIAPQIIPSAAQASAGFGWHIMFGAPGPWTGYAKICPGPQRIAELKSDIFPAIFRGGTGVVLPPAPKPPVGARPPALPRWSLPRGHYYGNAAGPAESHGGYYAAERDEVKRIQQWFVFKGCARSSNGAMIDPARWASTSWADGRWEGLTDDACMRWFARYFPGQPFTTRIYADDWVRLDD